MIKIEVVNVVATASMGQQIDFEELREFKEIFHDSDVYGGRVAYFKTEKMQGKVSIFNSGKMISVGTKSEKQAAKELQTAIDFLVRKGCAKPTRFDVQTRNIVLSADFGQSVNLEKLSEISKAMYEPEQFPGAILRFDKPYKASVLIFASGKVVIAGLTDSNQIDQAIQKIDSLIQPNL